tara:strand:+ start:404 stop:964 length:561 start_codon:yes stop_codon:yes gene_type:complete
MTVSVLDVLRTISSIIGKYGYDGALGDDGKPIDFGLDRDLGDPIKDSRVMDGFKVRFGGPYLYITYQGEVSLKDIHREGAKNFEDEIERKFANVSKFIKKEYGKMKMGRLRLKDQGPSDTRIQRISNYRNFCTSIKCYLITNISTPSGDVIPPEKESAQLTMAESVKRMIEDSSPHNIKNRFRNVK